MGQGLSRSLFSFNLFSLLFSNVGIGLFSVGLGILGVVQGSDVCDLDSIVINECTVCFFWKGGGGRDGRGMTVITKKLFPT